MKKLIDIIEKRMIYESYPIAFLGENKKLTPEETIETLGDIVYLLHKLDDKISDHEEKDLVDVKFYLTELYYEMKQKN
jgi:hypothetical protein